MRCKECRSRIGSGCGGRILGDTGEFTPGFEAIGEVFAIKRSAQQVTFEGKVLPDGTEAGQERLRALRVAKPTHAPLALTRGLMAVLGAIVHASAGFDEHVLDVGQLRHVGLRGRVAAQLIGDDLLRGTGQERSTRWKKRLAAAVSRRFCSRISSSAPCSSTARHSR